MVGAHVHGLAVPLAVFGDLLDSQFDNPARAEPPTGKQVKVAICRLIDARVDRNAV